MDGSIHRNLRQAYQPAAVLIFLLVGLFLPWRGMAQTVMNLQEYSFTNSPLLISPKVFRLKDGLLLVANARFMNDCLAKAGIDASFVDLQEIDKPGLKRDRVMFLHQRVAPNGCPDMFSPTVRAVEVFFQQADNIERIHVLDHVGLGESFKLMAPPSSLPVSSPLRNHNARPITLRVDAHLASNGGPEIPTLSSVRVMEVSDGQMFSYSVEITIPMPSGCSAEDAFAVKRYETRIGTDEKSPVIDWLVILWKQNLTERQATGTPEKTTFKIKLEAADSPPRQVGLINRISGYAYKEPEAPFAFFKVK